MPHRIRQADLRSPLRLCLLLLLTLSLSFSAKAQHSQDEDDDVVRVNTELVVLNVTVVDRDGRYVRGLKSSDFRLFEDGQEQSINLFTPEETSFAAAILLDTSGSMEQRVSLARSAAIRFLDGLREEDVAAVYRFDSEVEQVQEFSQSRDLRDVIFGLKARGLTALNDAIVRASTDLAPRSEKRHAIIVLSDGADTRSRASADKALAGAMTANATIYTVDMSGLGSAPVDRLAGAGALRFFANKTGGRYIATPGGQAMRDAFASIVDELGNQYTIAYRPTNKARDGRWRTISLKLSRPELAARTRQGYRAPKK